MKKLLTIKKKLLLFRAFSLFMALFMSSFIVLTAKASAGVTYSDLRSIINNTVYYDPSKECQATSSSILAGDDNMAKIFNYLVGKGLTDFQAAGILGNMQSESHFEPRLVQYGFANSRGEISVAGQPSSLDDNVPPGGAGYGIVQFTASNYKDDLRRISQEKGIIAGDLTLQLDYLWYTLTEGYLKGFADKLKATTDVASATLLFEVEYERHDGAPQPERIANAQSILDQAKAGGLQATASTSISGSTSTSTSTSTGQAVILLDPGHSGTDVSTKDPATGLTDHDYPNQPEMNDVFDVASRAKTALEQAGYRVVMTKNDVNDTVSLRQRADLGTSANATVAVSIHDNPGIDFGTWGEIYTQKVGLYRGTEPNKVTFTDQAIADKSQQYAQTMKAARDAKEMANGAQVQVKDNSFDGRAGLEPGNIPLVQLFAKVPWIYLEAGGGSGLNDEQKSAYANAIVEGIEKAVPTTGTGTNGCGGSAVNGQGIIATALNYAWPEYHRKPYQTMKPEYADAVAKARSEGRYVGGINYPGVDCGGFVTTAMIDSGFEPNYNYAGKGGATPTQLKWARENWQELGIITNSADLQPGDVGFYTTASGEDNGHTFFWVGNQPGFNGPIASSSLDSRAPMADNVEKIGPTGWDGSTIRWFRKK